ncbi:MAG: DNA polymerase III subunit beta, partial [Fimbriimonadales bacterium]
MRLDVPRREFHEAAAMANVATAGRTSIELLQSLRLTATEYGGLTILGCDGELWVERTVPCMVHEPGSWCVSGKLLVDLLGSLPDGDLHLEVDGHALVLSQGPSVYRVNVQDPSDFPEIPDLDGEKVLALPADLLKGAIDSVLYAVAKDGHRQILTGVLFECDGTALRLVSTDTHRLALRRIALESVRGDRPFSKALRHVAQEGEWAGPIIGSELNYVLPEKALRLVRNLA